MGVERFDYSMLYLFVALTFVSTLVGGLVGLKHKDKLHLVLGFTAGVLLGVVVFDIFHEIITLVGKLGIDPVRPMLALVAGFLIFHILEKVLLIHHAHEEEYGPHKHPVVGMASALALIGHSFLDGVGIGLGFSVSPATGMLIAIAVIAHDFTDGLNTVSLLLVHKNSDRKAWGFLLADALAPIAGAFSGSLLIWGQDKLILYLGFFAGFLLYIGVADILPEAHSQHSSWKTIMMTVLGTLLIFGVTRLL